MPARARFLPAAAAATAAILTSAGLAGPAAAQTPTPPPYLANFSAAQGWGFAPNLTPNLPGDVFVPAKQALENNQQFPQVQRLFDLWSWQALLAVSWPTGPNGQPAGSINGYDPTNPNPAWLSWHESDQIFLPNGAIPAACNAQTTVAAAGRAPRTLAVANLRGLPAPPQAAAQRPRRLLFNASAVGELVHGRDTVKPQKSRQPQSVASAGRISEIDQAFSGPLYDQNGNPTFYEILMDDNEANYICTNKLYNINGQVAFSSNQSNKVQFPSGTWQNDRSGAFELKLAWKILDPQKDNADRFFKMPAQVLLNGQWVERNMGLVGMHIAHKSQSSPQWIWSTFEQVDNLSTDQVANPNLNPSYNNPGCPTCVVNVQPPAAGTPTQVLRLIAIPPDKQALNQQAQAALKAAGSVWQHYQLIDTQWPTDPTAAPTPPGDANLPDSINNKSGGRPTPVFLTNATMETYFQTGNQNAAGLEENAPTSTQQAFGTESCMGCHSSAGVAVSMQPTYGPQLSGDFSWLLQMKAQAAQ